MELYVHNFRSSLATTAFAVKYMYLSLGALLKCRDCVICRNPKFPLHLVQVLYAELSNDVSNVTDPDVISIFSIVIAIGGSCIPRDFLYNGISIPAFGLSRGFSSRIPERTYNIL